MNKAGKRVVAGHEAYVKGLAITAIVLIHYTQYYARDVYSPIAGLANGFVAVFFVISGYGIYFSLQRRLADSSSINKVLTTFFFARAAKIMPYYWLSIFLMPFFFHEYDELHAFGFSTIAMYLGLPFVKPPGIFWFVTAIIQCYLLAPIFFILLKKLQAAKYILFNLYLAAFLLLATIVLTLAPARIGLPTDIMSSLEVFTYRQVLLTNIVLFGMGMAIQPLIEAYRERLQSVPALALSFFLFGFAVFATSANHSIFPNSNIYMTLVLIISSFTLCLFVIAINSKPPLTRQVSWLGQMSYPIYLFHMIFFGILATLGVIQVGHGNVIASTFTLILFPLFVVFCQLTEKLQGNLIARLQI